MSAAANDKLWPKYKAQLERVGDAFTAASNNFANWMRDTRAFYPAARPQILILFNTARNALSVNVGSTFLHRLHSTTKSEYAECYRKMVHQAWVHKERFREPHLGDSLVDLYESSLNETEFVEFQKTEAYRKRHAGITVISQPTEKIGPPSHNSRRESQNRSSVSNINETNHPTNVHHNAPTQVGGPLAQSRIPSRSPSVEEIAPPQQSQGLSHRRVTLKLGPNPGDASSSHSTAMGESLSPLPPVDSSRVHHVTSSKVEHPTTATSDSKQDSGFIELSIASAASVSSSRVKDPVALNGTIQAPATLLVQEDTRAPIKLRTGHPSSQSQAPEKAEPNTGKPPSAVQSQASSIAPHVIGASKELPREGAQHTNREQPSTSLTRLPEASLPHVPSSETIQKAPSPSALATPSSSGPLMETQLLSFAPTSNHATTTVLQPAGVHKPATVAQASGAPITASVTATNGVGIAIVVPPSKTPPAAMLSLANTARKAATIRKKKAIKPGDDFMQIDLRAHQNKKARESFGNPTTPTLGTTGEGESRQTSMPMSPTIPAPVTGQSPRQIAATHVASPLATPAIPSAHTEYLSALPGPSSTPEQSVSLEETVPALVEPGSARGIISPDPSRLDALRRSQAHIPRTNMLETTAHPSDSPVSVMTPLTPAMPPVVSQVEVAKPSTAHEAKLPTAVSDNMETLKIAGQVTEASPVVEIASAKMCGPIDVEIPCTVLETHPLDHTIDSNAPQVQATIKSLADPSYGSQLDTDRSEDRPPNHHVRAISSSSLPLSSALASSDSLQAELTVLEKPLVRLREALDDPENLPPKKRRRKQVLTPKLVEASNDSDSDSDIPLAILNLKRRAASTNGSKPVSEARATPISSLNGSYSKEPLLPSNTQSMGLASSSPPALKPASSLRKGKSEKLDLKEPTRHKKSPKVETPPSSPSSAEEVDWALKSLVNALHYDTDEEVTTYKSLTALEPSSGFISFKPGSPYPNGRLRFVIKIEEAVWERHVRWIDRHFNSESDLTSALCVSLESYNREACPENMQNNGEAINEVDLPPCRWPTIHAQGCMWANGTGPAYIDLGSSRLTEEGRFDLTSYCKPGTNRLEIINPAPANDYIFAVRIHQPTLDQQNGIHEYANRWTKLAVDSIHIENDFGNIWSVVDKKMRSMLKHVS